MDKIRICLTMYFYQSVKQKRDGKMKAMLALCVIGMSLFFMENGETGKQWGQEVVNVIEQEMIVECFPLVMYEGQSYNKETFVKQVLHYVLPFMKKQEEVCSYMTEVESELSLEMILALEASDEPYVEIENELPGAIEPETESEEAVVSETVISEKSVTVSAGQLPGKMQRAVNYPREKLADFDYLVQNFYRVDKTTTTNGEQLNATEMLKKDMTLTHDASSPQILIYHTHSQEGYVDSVAGDMSTTVVGVGDYLTTLLKEQYGLNAIHHTGQYDVETRDDAYSLAGPAVEQILAENPSIEVVIDLHRDGVGETTRLVTNVEGTDMAKIMFVNGLSKTTSVGDIGYLYNPNLSDNLAFSFQMQLATAEFYPGLSRGVYLKGYRYNLHYCPKSLLVEVGAQTNTLQEAKNAMVPLADIINKVVTTKASE